MENFNLKKFLVENKLTSNSRMLKEEQQPVETFTFGYDFEFVQEVEDYLADTYQEGTDYVTHIGREDDAMNALDILNPELLQDQELMSLIRNCTGEGYFEEGDEDYDDDNYDEYDDGDDRFGEMI
jgi:hypothetical protein